MRRPLMASGVAWTLCACLAIDTSDLTTDGAQQSAPPAKEVRPGACSRADDACYLVPAGWDGPFAVVDTRVDCPSEMPKVTFERSAGIVAPPATCQCSCGAPTGGTCSGVIEATSGPSCGTDCSEAAIPMGPGTCRNAGTCNGAAAESARTSGVVTSPPTCADGTVIPEKAPVSFERTLRACAPVAPSAEEGCGPDRRCAPSNVRTMCVVRAGDATCPGAYPNRVVVYAGTEDHRGCGPCTCAPTGLACRAAFVTCRGEIAPANGCIAGTLMVEYTGASVEATCAPRVSPIGTVNGIDPITVCCER